MEMEAIFWLKMDYFVRNTKYFISDQLELSFMHSLGPGSIQYMFASPSQILILINKFAIYFDILKDLK